DDRTSAFAVLDINKGGFLTQIIEKPSAQVANSKIDKDGVLRISMNIFRLPYERFLKITKACEFSEDRNERELPTAIQNFTKESPDRLFCIPYAGEFLDLTHPRDIEFVKEKLSHL
ncbi:MAG: sugar phosphate nucleotidyltransferase, partial [Flavobacteriales bacterium]